MLVNLTSALRRGIIDNTTRDSIRLLLWCADEERPVALEMSGNCLRDIAGCRVEFTLNGRYPSPDLARRASLTDMVHSLGNMQHSCIAGDITLSRRSPAQELRGALANLLSIEFFSGVQMRFLIESAEYEFSISLPEWECTRACESAQEIANMSALHDHVLANVAAFRGPSIAHLGEEMPPCRWDAVLNRAEAYMVIASSIHEKYMVHPRGRLAEAFVLDQLDFLDEKAGEAEQGKRFTATRRRAPYWEVLDFMNPSQADKVRQAMRHPLFEATANMSATVQRHIIEEMSHYRDSQQIDALLSSYSGIISHVLSTILLTQDEQFPLKTATTRVSVLCQRMERLKRYGKELRPKAQKAFLRRADALISELQNFLCTLSSN